MQFTTVTLLALASAAMASPRLAERQDSATPSSTIDQNSIVSVLLTALPSSILSVAVTNQAAASSIIISEMAAGTPQPWFSALPSDVQSYLAGQATTGGSITAAPTVTSGAGNATSPTIVSTPGFGNSSTNATTTRSSSSSSEASTTTEDSSSETATGSSSARASSSSGAASAPTAVIGAGIAGVVGFVGMLAL